MLSVEIAEPVWHGRHAMTTPAMMRKEFGRRLKAVRLATGYRTIRAFAQEVDVHEDTLGMWELGKRMPPPHELHKILKRTRVTSDFLYYGDKAGVPLDLYNKIAKIADSTT